MGVCLADLPRGNPRPPACVRPGMNRPSRVASSAVVVLVGLACLLANGCGVVKQVVDQPPPPHAAPGDVVFQVSYGGGMTTLANAVAVRPALVVYGDGRYLVPHDPDASGTAIRTFDQGQLSDHDLRSIEQVVASSRVFDDPDPDFGDPAVMDAGSTSVRGLSPDGNAVELDAYALGDGGTDA